MFQAPLTKHAQIQSHTDSAGPASTRCGTGLFLPFLALPVAGWGVLWLHPSYRPGTQDEWGAISWVTSLLTGERLLNCLQGNRALALGKGCTTSEGSEVLGKICGFKSFRVFNPDILIPCVSVLFFLKQGSNLGIKTYHGWEFNLWTPATLVIGSWATCLDFPAPPNADTFQSLLAVSQEVL